MDSAGGDDMTLPVDINGSCKLPDSINAEEYTTDSMTAPSFPDKMSPIKALTMKDYENQITALKKENFNLKLRIYFMEERMQQKCDDSTEDIFKTNIELKVELESMKKELAEKQELLISASKALDSLAGRESGEPHRFRVQTQRDMDVLREVFNKRIADLEQSLRMANEEVEKMASIAEQEKFKNINMEKQLHALGTLSSFTPVQNPDQDLQLALQEKDKIIEQLQSTLKLQETMIHQKKSADQETDAPFIDGVKHLTDVIAKKDQELEALRNELHRERDQTTQNHQKQGEASQLDSCNKLLTENLNQAKSTNETLTKKLEDTQNQYKNLLGNLDEKENLLNSERKNSLKRDKTIQGLTVVLREKEKEIAELCHEIEDRDDALSKAREAAHKAQLQKYQGVEEHQNLLMEKQTELAQLQGEHHAKVLEAQKLQRALERKEQELADLQQAKDQLDVEVDDLQLQKKRGDKAQNDLNNQLKKLSDEIGDRETALTQQYQEMLDQTKRKLQVHEVNIQRLTSTLADKEQQLQEYINMVKDFDQSKSPGGNEHLLSKLRQRLKEKETALEQALDAKFAAIEEKDNEIHQLQLSLREKERDLDRLNNLISHNDETINSFDSLIKEKDLELQHLANTIKNLQRAKQDVEDNLNRSLREKDSIISQLQLSLEGKTKDMEEISKSMLSQSQTPTSDLAEQMGQRLKVTEAMLAEAVKARERLVSDNESAVEGLLATISSKDQLLKKSAEHYNRILNERTQEIQEVRKQLSYSQQQIATADKQSCTTAHESFLETAELRALLAEKESIINKLLQRGQERDQFLAEMRQNEQPGLVLQHRQTIRIMQEKLDKREAELSGKNSEDISQNIPVSKNEVVHLKKELAQKTEALNKALTWENELKISLAELQSLLAELEGRNEGQAANIESLTATLKIKDDIINVLHQRLGQRGDIRVDHSHDHVIGSGMEWSIPELPQREMTMIGGDSQKEVFPNLTALQQEHDTLNKALRAEQQLYSNLVRTVKEQDSAQRLHALQLELTAVQLLRQKLEESIKTNEDLRDDLETEINRVKLREGMDQIDPKELESLRHQLEDTQRWNASLQARLGAIQNRGGGVGGANDAGDTLSFIGDQTSYMSICVGEGQDNQLSVLSEQELRLKVLELQDCVSRLQTVNNELHNQLPLLEKSEHDSYRKEDKQMACASPWKQQLRNTQAHSDGIYRSGQDIESRTDVTLGQMVSGKQFVDRNMDSGLGHSRENAQSGIDNLDAGDKHLKESNADVMALQSILTDCEATSISQIRELLLRLRSENADLQGHLKEQKSAECKEKESTDGSGTSSDGQTELRKSVLTLEAESQAHSKVIYLSKEASDMLTTVSNEIIGSTKEGLDSDTNKCQSQTKRAKQNDPRHGTGAKSRLPVPVRLKQTLSSDQQKADALQNLNLEDVYDCNQQPHTDCNPPVSPQHSASPSSTLKYTHLRGSSPTSDMDSEARTALDLTQYDSALFTQLELLHQECQEKEAQINKLTEQLADWQELHAELTEKDQLNCQYEEALHAAESTIAYLTACNLDGQGGSVIHTRLAAGPASVGSLSDLTIHRRCMELQKELLEKDELNGHLIELLNMAEKVITSSDNQEKNPETSDFSLKIETALQRVNTAPNRQSHRGDLGSTVDSVQEVQQHANSLQEELWEQNRINAELQEKLRTAHAATQNGYNSDCAVQNHKSSRQIETKLFNENVSKKHKMEINGSDKVGLNQEMTKVLMNCLSAAESAVASLAAHFTNTSSLVSGRSSHTSSNIKVNLDQLQRALQERNEHGEPPTSSGNLVTASSGINGQLHQDLHNNLCHLYKVFSDICQRISERQFSQHEVKESKEESKDHRANQDAMELSPSVQVQIEALHKVLRERKRACKSLEEKLATALTKTPPHETTQKALVQDDKGVQVDLQDLGYETSGKSENDREESSSTDIEVGVKPGCSASSLPSLLKNYQTAFSSTENLDSTSSTPYPSSPALSSAKVSLKSLRVYEEYGTTEDPLQLQGQVRELKVQLENQAKLIFQMQSLLRHNSLSSDLAVNTSDTTMARDQEGKPVEEQSQDQTYINGHLMEKKEGGNQAVTDEISHRNMKLDRERNLNRRTSEQLQQNRSRSKSPARLDSLVQSQARELSQMRQQIKESRRLGAQQRRQLEELNSAFEKLLQSNEVDYYMGEVVKEQLDKNLGILDKLEGWLNKGESLLENEDVAPLELSRRDYQPNSECLLSCEDNMTDPPDSTAKIQQDIDRLRVEVEGEREILLQRVGLLVQQNFTLAESTREQLDLLAKELQEKNRRIQSLQSQLRGQSVRSHHSSHSDLHCSDRTSSSCYSSQTSQSGNQTHSQLQPPDWIAANPPVEGTQEEGVSNASRLQGRQRENGRLQEQLRSSEELNTTLRSELDLHHSIMAQCNCQYQEQNPDHKQARSGPRAYIPGLDGSPAEQPCTINSDLLKEHLQEIRALRQRLEESIRTNDCLREQLERRLADAGKDPATNIFIHGNEEQAQLANEVRFLWEQNQILKDQLNMGSRDKQKENDKLRETLARRTAKFEQSRRECDALRQEKSSIQKKLVHSSHENSQLQETLQYSKEELHRLQCEVKLQRQQLSDSQHLLQSLRVELQVYEKMKTQAQKHNESNGATKEPVSVPSSNSVDLGELLSEIRHLRVQLERSIQTNTALRQRLEEQLLRGANRSETININYLLSSPDEGGKSPGREDSNPLRHSFQSHNDNTSVLHDEMCYTHSEVDGGSASGSSDDSVYGAPSRLVPGHRMWANRNGRHILGLIEDYSALRKQISEGRKLSNGMITQLQEYLHALRQQGSDKVIEEQHLKSLSGSMNAMQHVLEEAGQLLKLVWRVSLPAGNTAGDHSNNQQDELLKNEIARLKSRLSQQERILSGAVKRLRTTNQLKEGMERVIIDQLCVTHGVLKKARGNLEELPVNGTMDHQPVQIKVPVCRRTADSNSESSEDQSLYTAAT